MQTQTMEVSLSNELMEGEQLIWSGRSEPRGKSAKRPRRDLLIGGLVNVFLGLLFTILLSLYNMRFSYLKNFNPFAGPLVLGGLFFLLGAVLICSGFFVTVAPTNTWYAITNRRVIIMRTGRVLCVDSYSKESIRHVRRIERADESGDLLFATQTGSVFMGNSNSNHMINGQGAFVAIANVRQVEKKLLSTLHEGFCQN